MASTLGRRKKQAKLSAPVALTNENDGLLPTDVLYEVLLRLPAKELCRLRLVCRAWRSLTSDPGFARAHASRHPPLVAGIWNSTEVHLLDLTCRNIIVRRLPLLQKQFCATFHFCTPWRAPIFARRGKSHDLPRRAFFIYRGEHVCPPR